MRQAVFAMLIVAIFGLPVVVIADGREFAREFGALVQAARGNPVPMKAIWFPDKVAELPPARSDELSSISAMGAHALANVAGQGRRDGIADSQPVMGIVAARWVNTLATSLVDVDALAGDVRIPVFVAPAARKGEAGLMPFGGVSLVGTAVNSLNIDAIFAAARPATVTAPTGRLPAGRGAFDEALAGIVDLAVDQSVADAPASAAPVQMAVAQPAPAFVMLDGARNGNVDGGFTAALPPTAIVGGLTDVVTASQ